MAWAFVKSNTVKISAFIDGENQQYTTAGIANEDSITPAVAKAQLDKLFGIVGKSVKISGMKMTDVKEVDDVG